MLFGLGDCHFFHGHIVAMLGSRAIGISSQLHDSTILLEKETARAATAAAEQLNAFKLVLKMRNSS